MVQSMVLGVASMVGIAISTSERVYAKTVDIMSRSKLESVV